MNIKNEVLIRVYIVLAIVVMAALVILAKVVYIQVKEGDKWRAKGKNLYVEYRAVEAERGSIMTEDGSLLATSLPFFDIRLDLDKKVVSDKDFIENLDSLAYCLANFVDTTYTVGGMRERLLDEREKGNRYILIKKNVSYPEMEKIKQFPLFNLGWNRFRGGIFEQKALRNKPFKMLARRTIGYVREGHQAVGLEGYFNDVLKGQEGKRPMLRVPGGNYIPINDLTEIEPKTGDDIVTTIDINIQDIAHEALLRALQYHKADYGTAIVMDVKTGAIRAIANIGKVEYNNKTYWDEVYNYAIGTAVEPGSTFKLAPLMALLEDGYVDLFDKIPLDSGRYQFYEELMEDASYHPYDSVTVKQAFEMSSNVGIARMVQKYYGTGDSSDKGANPKKFLKRLKQFNLHLPIGIEIEGEAAPYIKDPDNPKDKWSGTTLPWMAIGYELQLTPLQLLNLYNAVANDGVMMKPYLVTEIQRYGDVIKKFKPTVTKRKLASKRTIEKVKVLLEGVVENGTAKKLKSNRYRFAGKTGTAQINYKKTKRKSELKYRASFAGYFPAENPVYSCIVVITNPREHGIYGGEVAGPVFREIADKCFTSKIELQVAVNDQAKPKLVNNRLPNLNIGRRQDMETVLRYLDLPFVTHTNAHWVVSQVDHDTLNIVKRTIKKEIVPNVVGMGLRDALYILENLGLVVQINGVGKVVRQSIIPGTTIKGQTIKITLR